MAWINPFARSVSGTPADDLAPGNRFSVTVYLNNPLRPVDRKIEVLRESEYRRCQSVQAELIRDRGEVIAVTGFSFKGYGEAEALARYHARRAVAVPA